MSPLQSFTTILALLSFSVRAFPLSQRDVIAPKIFTPNADSVWPIGTQQLVTWDTSQIPPPSQVTNPIGQVILGFNESNSLNLDLNNPLAQNFNLTDGNVTITVPDVPPRDDYLIVLLGDSGDTSPAFAITRISSAATGNSSSSPSGSITDSSVGPATFVSVSSLTLPASIGGASIAADPTTAPSLAETTTTDSISPAGSSNSASAAASASASAASSSSSTSSGCSLHRGSSTWSSTVLFLMSVAPLVMVFI